MKKLVAKRPVLNALGLSLLVGASGMAAADVSNPTIGSLLFEEQFNTLNPAVWNAIDGDGCAIGLCGWGNQELQWYSPNNLAIEPVPGEPGNSALVLEARAEAQNGSAFTSGKVDTHNNLAVQYGMIEVRMRVPEVGVGLWPAAWMLGTSTASWPAKGEIDMMEMGHRAQGRADAGHAGADINSYVGSNAIFYSDAACVPENPTCAAMTAWQTDNAYVAATPLSNRFVTYRTYWTDSQLRFTVVDNGVEYDMYDAPIDITEESSELQQPFYLLLNLAVGGNFTDAANASQVTAPLPAKMYIDYVRVYELNGQGQVFTGNITPPEVGTFGVFTDTTPTNNKLEAGVSSDIYIWNQDSVGAGTEAPAEGDNVIAWHYNNPGQWFGGGIQSRQSRDLSNFADGALKFKIKMPADVGFKVGIADTYTNENWLEFPAYETTYGLVRNGDWAEASIPVSDLRGQLIAMQSLAGVFYIASLDGQLPTQSFQFALDDIRYEGGGSAPTDSDGDGVPDAQDQCPNTPANTPVNAAGCALPPQGVDVQIEAEDYTAHYDTTAGNTGGAYRTDDVDIEVSGDGGHNVGWTAATEWLEYTVDMAAGTYQLTTRVASAVGGGSYTVSIDGSGIASDTVGNTGGWQSYETHALTEITLAGGTHTVRIDIAQGEFNLDWIKWLAINTDTDGDGVPNDRDQCPNTPAGTQVDAVGCTWINTQSVTVQAEDYAAFSDTTVGNTGGVYREDDVDLEATTDAGGGYNLGWTEAGEWLEYSVFLNAGTYDVSARVASQNGGAAFTVWLAGNSLGQTQVAATAGWQSWQTVAAGQVTVASGQHTLRVNVDAGGFNLNWLQLNEVTVQDSDNDGVNDSADLCPGTASGVNVDANGCAVTTGVYGVEQVDATSLRFYVNTGDWADLHYRINGGGQINVAMTQAGGENSYVVSGLSAGDVVSYDFTYWDAGNNFAVQTDAETVTLGSQPPADSDGDGVADNSDACPDTPAGSTVDANGCAINAAAFGLTATGADSINFFVNANDWAIVHYSLDNGTEINQTMTQSGGQNVWPLSGLANGTRIHFWFTYWDTGAGYAVDTAAQTYTVGGATPPVGDSDNDGVNDDVDMCPGTPPGTQVDSAGCPLVATPNHNEVGVASARLVGGVDSAQPGFTLYVFDNDQGTGGSSCEGACVDNWPPLLVTDGTPSGVGGLSAITRTTGEQQVTYNGRPLYFYAGDNASGQTNGDGVGGVWWAVPFGASLGDIVPLYNDNTPLEPPITYDRGDALVTRFSDRARDRHAKENHFQAYDHYLTFYWEDRTAAIEIVDYVAKGGSSIRMNVVSQNKLDDTEAENRWWYMGNNTLAEYCGNGVMNMIDFTHYWKEESWNCRENRPIQIGDKMEFEISQFLDPGTLPRGRSNYYGTTYLYIVGEGLVPWDVTDKVAFQSGNSFQRDSIPVPAHARLGGDTTLHVQMTAEPDGHFQQMATNLGFDNGQPFVLGRRVHHTSFVDGTHDENPENGVFDGMPGLAGPHYINQRCVSCHERNGRAPVAGIGESLDRWVFKVGDANGNPHPELGAVLQPKVTGGAVSEGAPSIAFFTEQNGLRTPNYQFTGIVPDTFSARIAPQLNGIGLLEAIPETAILALADENDSNGDGISGRPARVVDPVTGDTRLGRFGYKAATASVKHQVAAAFNTDMGVMTSVLPAPDCGANQSDCGPSGVELADEHLDNLVKYVSLLGVRPQRDYNDPQVIQGKSVFGDIGCSGCHTDTFQTSAYHPLAELRDQTIHPYTDMLLHDMGPGLADSLGEGEATGAEWRTAPLWGLGLSACVTGGVAGQRGWDAFGLDGHEYCTPHHSYLHDGRARTIDEAIRWHGGEGEASKVAYENLSTGDRAALLAFLNSL